MASATTVADSPRHGELPNREGGPLDTTVRLVSPERIQFEYPLAGPFRRVVAYILDLAFCLALMFVAALLAARLARGDEASGGLVLVAFFVLQWGFGAFCEATFNGQTPGKMVARIRVVSTRGTPITASQAFLRNLTWTIEGIWPFGLTPALAVATMTSRFQRLGDLLAGTMVVVERRPSRTPMARPMDPGIQAILNQLPHRVEANPLLARALADYVKHRGRFGLARREEMAEHLAQPVRERYGLNAETSADAVLCALYHRVFLED